MSKLNQSKTAKSPANSRSQGAAAPAKARLTEKLDLISFKEALGLANGAGKKHLMLGNGFSIALFRNIFSYNTLFERAMESKKTFW